MFQKQSTWRRVAHGAQSVFVGNIQSGHRARLTLPTWHDYSYGTVKPGQCCIESQLTGPLHGRPNAEHGEQLEMNVHPSSGDS